jgi:hypothetical protein
VGKSAAAFVYDADGALRIQVLNPGTTEFVTDNSIWAEVHFDRDSISKPLNRIQFERVVLEPGGNPTAIPA